MVFGIHEFICLFNLSAINSNFLIYLKEFALKI